MHKHPYICRITEYPYCLNRIRSVTCTGIWKFNSNMSIIWNRPSLFWFVLQNEEEKEPDLDNYSFWIFVCLLVCNFMPCQLPWLFSWWETVLNGEKKSTIYNFFFKVFFLKVNLKLSIASIHSKMFIWINPIKKEY